MGRMIAIDLDGTLLDDNLMVSQANIDSINEAIKDGFKIVICTGRPYAGMKKFITEFCSIMPRCLESIYQGSPTNVI